MIFAQFFTIKFLLFEEFVTSCCNAMLWIIVLLCHGLEGWKCRQIKCFTITNYV